MQARSSRSSSARARSIMKLALTVKCNYSFCTAISALMVADALIVPFERHMKTQITFPVIINYVTGQKCVLQRRDHDDLHWIAFRNSDERSLPDDGGPPWIGETGGGRHSGMLSSFSRARDFAAAPGRNYTRPLRAESVDSACSRPLIHTDSLIY